MVEPITKWREERGWGFSRGPQQTIDTQADTYEEAVTALRAAYGRGSQT
jgi:predicted RNase H-like HicB family nuclease